VLNIDRLYDLQTQVSESLLLCELLSLISIESSSPGVVRSELRRCQIQDIDLLVWLRISESPHFELNWSLILQLLQPLWR
jgi:hypothetical protein